VTLLSTSVSLIIEMRMKIGRFISTVNLDKTVMNAIIHSTGCRI
jgi:hypothetical protein